MDLIFEKLSKLDGLWKGRGKGQFPTIDSFEYEEQLRFEVNLAYPLIHYEQKTILLPMQQQSHWESGFIRVLDEDVVEISNAQDSGRVEVLQGRMVVADDGFELEFESVVLGNDPRMIKTSRVFKMVGNTLEYHQSMATNTSQEPVILPHLFAQLTKVE